jgi:Skp family chaperone for outer membrane proteins
MFSRKFIAAAPRLILGLILGLIFGAALCLAAGPALAQSSPGYFMPPSSSAAPPPAPVHHAVRPAAAPPVAGAGPNAQPAQQPNQQPGQQQAQANLPAVPQLPALPKVAPPPNAVIGVLSVPEVMQKSTAAQGVQEIIHDRQAALGGEAQTARTRIQNEQARIVAQRGKLSDAQLEAKEKALQDEIATTQASFQLRNQAIQNSGQAALGQIEAELIGVIRQVAQSHGMNLVLHREQVALNVDEFDITGDVVTQLNKLLPAVPVPPSVVTPGMHVDAPEQTDEGGQ